MGANDATVIVGTLSDEQLVSQINKLVNTVDQKTKKMSKSFDNFIDHVNGRMKDIGNIKIDSGTVSDSGSTKATNAQKALGQEVERTTQKVKEQKITFDQAGQAMQVAIRKGSNSYRNADTLQTMQTSLDLQKEKLRELTQRLQEARQQYSSFVAMAAQGARSGDTGLYKFATDGVRQYEQEVKALIPQIRTTQSAIAGMESAIKQMGDVIAPQGHTLQNYINSIGKVSPELRQLGEQIKNGSTNIANWSTETAGATSSANRYTEAIRKQAQAIRESQQWQEKGYAMVGDRVYYDPERSVAPAKNRLSLEEQILNTQKEEEVAAIRRANAERQEAEEIRRAAEEAKVRLGAEREITAEQQKRQTPKTFAGYDDLQQGIASVLKIQKNQVQIVDEQTNSYDRLSKALKQYKQAYNMLTESERSSDNGRNLLRRIQEIERAAQKLQSQMSRPISLKSVMGLSESSLDDIAYKMRQLQSYRQSIDLTKPTAASDIRIVSEELSRLQKEADKWMGRTKTMLEGNNALARSWNYMKNRLAFYFTVGASTQFVKNLIEVRSQYEMNERALGILIDSAERGTQIFKELSQMALVSPYTLIELSNAAKQLTAYDIAAKDVVDTTRRLADMTAAVGIPVERLTYALGQIKAYGYLNSRDARMFANAGIPLVKQLADYYTQLEGRMVSTADVYDRMKKKAIDYNEVMDVVYKMTDEGGKFFDFQAKMAETLKVQIANLTLAWNNMLNDIGESQQGMLSGGIQNLKQIFLHWKEINKALTDVVAAFGIVYGLVQMLNFALGKGVYSQVRLAAATEGTTVAEYKSIISKNNLNAAQLRSLVSLNRYNGALIQATASTSLLSAKELTAAANAGALKTLMYLLQASALKVDGAMKSLAATMSSNMLAIASFAAVAVAVDLMQTIDDRMQKTKEFGEAIVKNAKENAEAIRDLLDSLSFSDATTLSVEEQTKAWERLREQIELSAAAANIYIAALMKEPDMGKRVNSAKAMLQELESIHSIMQYWHKDDIHIGQDFKVLGIGVDGMATDLDNYIESYHKYVKNLGEGEEIKFAGEQIDGISMAWGRAVRSAKGYVDFWSHGANIPIISSIAEIASSLNAATWAAKGLFGGSAFGFDFSGLLSSSTSDAALDLKELKKEAKDYVDSLKAELDTDEVTDPLKIREALQQTLIDAGLAGEKLKTMTIISEQMLREMYQNVYESADAETKKHWDTVFGYGQSSMEEFMLFVRSRNSTLLSNIAEEDINKGKWLTEYLEKFKNVNVLAYQDLKSTVNDMNKLSVFIPVIFGVKTAAKDLQEDFKNRLGVTEQSTLYQDVAKNAETMSDIITTLQNNQEKKAKEIANVEAAGGEYAEKHLATLKQENNELVNAIHSYNAKTKAEEKAEKDRNKGKGGKKDELLDALKQEISLVNKLQSEYDKLTSKGLSHADSLDVVQSAYEKTINLLNNKLKSAGLPQLDLSILTGKDPNKQLKHFQDTLNMLVSKGLLNLERSKELEAVIEKLAVDAKTYNLDKITKGLNNELSKLKEDYELAVELDAEPELGKMFANMLGIDVSNLPKSFSDAIDKAQSAINSKLKEMNIATPFDVMRTDIKDFAKMSGLDMDSSVVKELENAQKAWRDIFKKNLTETEKYLDDYVKKYGDYSDRIAEIEASRLEKLKKLNEAYFTEEMRKLPEYAAKLNAIEQGSKKEKQQVKFDEFKDSRYYTMMFENLDYISTKTIRDMRDRLRDLMDSMDSLTPEQLKAVIKQYETIEKKLAKRSPFKTLGKDVKEYLDTMSDRKKANEAFRIAQQEYDKQKDIVAELKEKYEVVKRIEMINPTMVAALLKQINSESELLKILKEKLELAEKTADKYNLIKKTVGEELAQTAQMITANLSSLDDLRDNLQETFGIHFSDALNDAIDGMAQLGDGISNVISSAQSGNIIGVISGIASAIGDIGTAFGLGAEDYFTPMKESVEKLISVMQKIADYQLKALQEMSGGRAVAEYRKLIKNNDEVIKSYRELAKAAGESGASAGSHSYAVRTNKRLADSWRQISSIVGSTVTKVDDLYKLSPEKLKKLMTEMPTIWQKITPEIREALEGIIEYGDKAVEYTEKLGEALTNITLDQLTDDFESMLRDMDNDAEKFAENFEEYMRNAIVRSMMTEMFSGRLEAWYENFKKSMEDSVLTEEEVNALREEYMGIVNDALNMRDQLFSVVGGGTGDKNLSALQQGIQGITEDTAGALEAYMNGVSQQVYLHSELLTQIRDAVLSINSDVTLGIQSQILLELQNSYQVQSMISTMLAGWSNPSGQAVRVEMV